MRWPHGRYNGSRLVGVVVKVRLDVSAWRLWVYRGWGQCSIGLGPVHIWMQKAYEEPPRAKP